MTLSQIIDLVIDPELSEASQWLRSKESACQCRRRGFDSDQACSAELTSVVRENTGTPQSPFILSFTAPWGLEVGGVLLRGARSPAGWLQRPQPQGATHVSPGGGVTLGREGSAAALSRLLLELTHLLCISVRRVCVEVTGSAVILLSLSFPTQESKIQFLRTSADIMDADVRGNARRARWPRQLSTWPCSSEHVPDPDG